jgi:hypothetical protein
MESSILLLVYRVGARSDVTRGVGGVWKKSGLVKGIEVFDTASSRLPAVTFRFNVPQESASLPR